MRYTVIAMYPALPIKKRITEYSNKNEAYEYISGLRFCETPYVMFDNDTGKVLDSEGYGMTKADLAGYINAYCQSLQHNSEADAAE